MSVALEAHNFYHIYNRANGREKLFGSRDNYMFFLKRYKNLICPITETFAYCLMPNHFHFLVKIKSDEELMEQKGLKNDEVPSKFVSKSFSNLFSSYTQAFNKQQGRMGSLFMKNFKRKLIDSEDYLRKLVHYIHYNPVSHGYCDDLSTWRFSSYNAIVSNKKTLVKREEVLSFFEDLENFKYCHRQIPKLTGIE